jgi:hypothetical protein
METIQLGLHVTYFPSSDTSNYNIYVVHHSEDVNGRSIREQLAHHAGEVFWGENTGDVIRGHLLKAVDRWVEAAALDAPF